MGGTNWINLAEGSDTLMVLRVSKNALISGLGAEEGMSDVGGLLVVLDVCACVCVCVCLLDVCVCVCVCVADLCSNLSHSLMMACCKSRNMLLRLNISCVRPTG